MITPTDWKSKTFVAGHRRSAELTRVDQALAAYNKIPRPPGSLSELCDALEAWAASKTPAGGGSGYEALLKGNRNSRGAVQQLAGEVRGLAGKAGHWPDTQKGGTYVVDLNQQEVELLRKMRGVASHTAIMMIAAMEVDWKSFAFDQVESASSLAVDLGHTDYGSGWDGAQGNLTSVGQMGQTTLAKLMNLGLAKANDELVKDERVEYVLKGAGLSIGLVLGVVKNHVLKEGVLSKTVPLLGPIKEAVDAAAKGGVELRLAQKSFQRVDAARTMILPSSDAAIALGAFEKLLRYETTKSVTNLSYRLLKDTALVVTEVLTLGAMTVVQVVSAIVEVVVGFIYQLVYSLVFRSTAAKCREWVQACAAPDELDLRDVLATCPLLGAYFLLGLSSGGGSVSALAMFGQAGRLSSTDFQDASVKLLRARQAAAAYVAQTPVKVQWTGPHAEKFKWLDGLVKSDALSASVGLSGLKIHHWHLSEDASRKDRIRHRLYQVGDKSWAVGKAVWGVV